MKKLMSFLAVTFLVGALASNTYAHSHLTGSYPQEGERVTEEVKSITLDFDGEIMEGSFIELTSTEGESFDVSNIDIADGKLSATLANPLPNGEYKVKWSIISADGHPLEGEYGFTLNAVESNPNNNSNDEGSDANEDSGDTVVDKVENDSTLAQDDPNFFTYIIFGVAIIILIAGAILLFRKKK